MKYKKEETKWKIQNGFEKIGAQSWEIDAYMNKEGTDIVYFEFPDFTNNLNLVFVSHDNLQAVLNFIETLED